MSNLIVFNKPYHVLSQFSAIDDKTSLAKFIHRPNVYAAGRLDYDSEGLLLLTDDGALQARISHPDFKLPKTYWVQVEGQPTRAALDQLSQGVTLNDGKTRPAKVRLLDEPELWPRQPPIRQRANQPTSWVELTITEGRNRQVRRMTAHIGHPTLRLIRVAIGPWSLDGLQPGETRELVVNLPNRTKTADNTRKNAGNKSKAGKRSKTSPFKPKRPPVHQKPSGPRRQKKPLR